jgi:hypothetical protein
MEICHWWQSSLALGFSRVHPFSYLASSFLEYNHEEQKVKKERKGACWQGDKETC